MSVFVFFFKQKTAYEMRISDWSSDVCSSDLLGRMELHAACALHQRLQDHRRERIRLRCQKTVESAERFGVMRQIAKDLLGQHALEHPEIGRASCRERVCQYV